MAPLAFGDKINLYSMIGTWLGTLFTLFGLVAVIAQLRSLLKDFSISRNEIVRAAAGDWSICLPKIRGSSPALIEGKAPSLKAWIHHYYNTNKSIVVCPYDRKTMSGQSSWSQLFCRLQIHPEELLQLNSEASPSMQDPTTADILVNGSKISYGFPGNDFATLLILAGFSPSSFDPMSTTRQVSPLGYMHLAAHTDPFSQLAQMDGGTWNCSSTVFRSDKEWVGRYADRMNVRHCLDLALGILRFECSGKPATIMIAAKAKKTGFGASDEKLPWSKPAPAEILKKRKNLTSIIGGIMDENDLYAKSAFPDLSHLFPDEESGELQKQSWPGHAQRAASLEFAFALSALKPWGLLAVIPRTIVEAFCPFLENIIQSRKRLYGSSLTLISKFQELPTLPRRNIPHRTRETMESALGSLSEVETAGFSGRSARCSLYYDAMIYVFEYHNIKLEDVETTLAATCATNLAISIAQPSRTRVTAETTAQFSAWVRECLKGEPMDEIEPWACEILAVYLHAWLQVAEDIKDDFLENLRRRVFLG